MNASHLHLILTHVPVLGTLFGLCLLLLAIIKRSDELKRTALLVFVVAAVLVIPAYVTGEPAGDHLKRLLPGKTIDAADQHSEIAIVALTGSLLLGLVSLGGLWFGRSGREFKRRFMLAVLLMATTDSFLLGWTANLGGRIRHTETATSPTIAPQGTAN